MLCQAPPTEAKCWVGRRTGSGFGEAFFLKNALTELDLVLNFQSLELIDS